MLNLKGLASYCQECGACAACRNSDGPFPGTGGSGDPDDRLVDRIVGEILKSLPPPANGGRPAVPVIPLGVSNRHMHVREDTFRRMFGPDAALDPFRDLFQPGEFAARQTVTVVGPKLRAIQGVRILGPFRAYDQVELSLTDAIGIGIQPPVRNSGDLKGAAPLTVVGPAGSVFLNECAIVANRHVHMAPSDAAAFGVRDGDFIRLRIGGEKGTIYENVLVRVNDAWKLMLHLDTDDANAANVRCRSAAEFAGKM
jgi:putative phosphotransacetylase